MAKLWESCKTLFLVKFSKPCLFICGLYFIIEVLYRCQIKSPSDNYTENPNCEAKLKRRSRWRRSCLPALSSQRWNHKVQLKNAITPQSTPKPEVDWIRLDGSHLTVLLVLLEHFAVLIQSSFIKHCFWPGLSLALFAIMYVMFSHVNKEKCC